MSLSTLFAKLRHETGIDRDPTWERGYENGAAVAFGLMGMAEAIRRRCRILPPIEIDVPVRVHAKIHKVH